MMVKQKVSSEEMINVLNEDIKNICERHYQKIFSVANSYAFIFAGVLYTLFYSFNIFLYECIFIAFSFILQAAVQKVVNQSYSEYRKLRVKTFGKISSFICSRLSIISNQAKQFACEEVNSQIVSKSLMEKKHRILKGNINLFICEMPTVATMLCCIMTCNEVSHNFLQGEKGITVIYICGYILWETIKLIRIKNSYASYLEVEKELRNMITDSDDKEFQVVTYKEGIKLQNVMVRQNNKIILEKFSFNFLAGKKYLLIGKSGSGKSTLFKTLLGQMEYSGKINGNEYNSNRRIREINYLPQNVEILPDDIYANITLKEQSEHQKIECILDQMKWNRKNTSLAESVLSGGEIKKIEFMRGMFYFDRTTWLLDEPFEGVDSQTRRDMMQALREYDGMVILASHIYLNELIDIINEIIIMEEGNLIYCGKYETMPILLKKYYF